MTSHIVIFGLILIFYVANISVNGKNCANTYELCKEDSDCCNVYNKCFLGQDNKSYCNGDGLLWGGCNKSIECSKVVEAKCGPNGTCVCEQDQKPQGRKRCKPNHIEPGVTWHDSK